MNHLKSFSLIIILLFAAIAAAFGQQASGGKAPTVQFGKDANDAAVIEILEKHIAAIGGRDAFASIKTVETQIERQVLGRTINVYQLDDRTNKHSYRRQDGGGGVIELGFDGARAWQKAPFFRGYLQPTSPQAKSLMRGRLGLFGTSLYDYKEGGKKFSLLPNEKVSGKEHLVVKSTETDDAGKELQVKYYFDPATYLIKQIVNGSAVTQTEVFDDYRKIDGRTIAFIQTITNPQVMLTSKVKGIKFNVPVTPAIFQYRDEAANSAGTAAPTQPAATNTSSDTLSVKQANDSIGDALPEAIRLETFEFVWRTINDTYWDRTFNGVNWQAIQDKYLPLARTTAGSEDFHHLLNRMVQELHMSHFKVAPPSSVATLNTNATDLKNLRNGAIGLGLQWIDNQMLVSDVEKDSPAQAAGIRKGFAVGRINGKTVEELYAEYKRDNPGYQFREELARVRALNGELAGKPGTKINLEVLDERGNKLPLGLVRQARPPGRQLDFESRRLAADIGYIKFNFFFGDALTKFQEALSNLRDTKTLIIDLRGNPGGAGDMAPAMANLLCAAPGSLGSSRYRYETQQFSYQGTSERAYKGRVVLLVDEGSASTSEVFTGGLQESGRATVIGATTAGAVLPSLAELLPTGGALIHVISNFQTPKGIVLEGRGVHPDIAVKPLRADFLAGRDTILQRAIEISRSSTPLTKSAVK